MNRDDRIEAVANVILNESREVSRNNYSCIETPSGKSNMDVGKQLAKAAIEAYEKTLPSVKAIEKVLVLNTEITGSGYFANSKQVAKQIHNLNKGVK